MRRVKVGIIGCGRIGKVHAENLLYRVPNAQPVAFADIRKQAADECAAKLGVHKVFENYRALLEDEGIEAVLICSSTETHAQIAIDAVKKGKHIFCEKPLAPSLPEIDRILEAVERAGVKLQVGFNRRFDPSFWAARELISQGKIGKPHILRITSHDPEPPSLDYLRVSGGIFTDMTIHDFDMARYLIGDEVEEVYAIGCVLIDPQIAKLGDIDTAITVLKFKGGALGAIENSRKAIYGYDQRIEVFGERGMVAVSNRRPEEMLYSNEEGLHLSKIYRFFLDRYEQSFVDEMKAFIQCILEDKPPPVTGLDGRMAMAIAQASKKSYEEGRPVKLGV